MSDNIISSGNVIKLNVGGKIFLVAEATLLKHPACKLANIVSNSIASEYADSCEIFLDTSPSLFAYVLDWLRYGRLNPGKDGTNWEALQDVAMFLNLPEMKEAIQKRKLDEVLEQSQEKFERDKRRQELFDKLDDVKNSIEALTRCMEGQRQPRYPPHPPPYPDFPNPDPWM